MAAPEKNEARAKALQTSYADTTAWLIAGHKAEFDAHRKELLASQGHEWSPPLTAEERTAKAKAEQEERDAVALKKILARSPAVLDHVLQDGANAEAAASVKPVTDPHS